VAERAVEGVEGREHGAAFGSRVAVLQEEARHPGPKHHPATTAVHRGNPLNRRADPVILGSEDSHMTDLARPLVGRERELELIEELLEGTCAGDSRFLFVSGEPGIGKTRLLAELIARAGERGCLALHGSAAEFERALPFGLVVDALDEYLESLDPHAFQRLAGEDLAELAGVFPALRTLDPGSDQPSTAAERLRAHRAVCGLLEHLAAGHPVVLALDDLHWADGASLELASHLLRRPPRAAVMVAATFRRGHVDRELVSTIERGMRDPDRRLDLGPLPRAQAHALVGETGAAEYERLYEASGGNPLYLLELARLGGPRPVADDVAVPDAVASATAGELEDLSARGRGFAVAAAVAGDPFELDLTGAIADMPEADALEALDELVACDLVRTTHVPRRFRFRHPLVRRAVYESCSPGARIAAHRRGARALASRGAPATARAHHVEQSARHGDMAAVAVLRDAGEAAAKRAPVSAARWFAVALGLLPEKAERSQRMDLLIALAGAQAATGRFEASRTALLESIDLTARDETKLRVQLIGSCAAVEQLLGHHEQAHARLAATLGELTDGSSPQAVELMLHLAAGDFYRMDYEGMRGWGERALGVARALDEPLTAASMAVLAVAAAFMGPVAEAEAYRAEAAALVDVLPDDDLAARLDALTSLSAADLYLHRYADAESHANRGLELARSTGQGHVAPFLIPVVVTVLHTTGRVTEAADLLEEAVESARMSGNVEALGWNLLSRGYVAVAGGDLELALSVAQESVEVTRDLDDRLVSTYARWAFASALLEKGDPGRAIEVLVTAAEGKDLPRIPLPWRPHYFELLTRSWLALGRPMEAEKAATRAATTAERVGLTVPTGPANRAAAAVALARRDPRTAADRALAAAVASESGGARIDGARARTLAGRALAAAGEQDRAIAELEAAARELAACSARRYRDEAEHEMRRLGRRFVRSTRRRKPDGNGLQTLTDRELEVARLVVDRRTNPEIAGTLVLSEKTIETHMRNIFRKLGVSSRADVARTLERQADPRHAP
jgi:DNA-binding NarL/FixJ family response regulator/tetratricopeptide (TPR) repeat protein